MIESPGVWWRFHEDEVTRQQVRPGTARRVWPYLRRYRGPKVLLGLMSEWIRLDTRTPVSRRSSISCRIRGS